MPLRTRIHVLFVVLVLLFGLNAGLAIAAIRERDHSQRETSQVLEPARSDVAALSTALVDQETGERGFLITGEDSFLTPYRRGQRVQAQLVVRLRRRLAGHRGTLVRLDAVVEGARVWRARSAEPEIAARRVSGAMGAARLVQEQHGRQLFDGVRADVSRLGAATASLLAISRHRADSARTRLSRVVLGSLFAALVVTLLAAATIRVWLTRPLRVLEAAVARVAGGDLRHSVPSPGPPELAALGANVDRMRRRILDEANEALRLRQAMAQSSLAVLTIGAELAPSAVQLPPGVDAAGRLRPAEGTLAGDWFDFTLLEGGRVGLAVTDVSGHGAVAGIIALRAKQLIQTALRMGFDPGDALGWVSGEMGDMGEYFLTCILADIDPATGSCRYANAGHPPALVVSGDDVALLGPTGPLLGPVPSTWDTATTHVGGRLLVAYTDGLTEARNHSGEEFGVERLVAALREAEEQAADTVVAAAIDAVLSFTDGRATDDVTLVVVRTRPGDCT